ncbi:hypothetical protein [Paraburkholderia sp.]|uniref:hypothetical protein n=1 Tax=Paraburkholderia sp. TaxID=1926495 RepID=UPI00286F5E23|nr:hypothetical protein [Paraburkholderia sp.]
MSKRTVRSYADVAITIRVRVGGFTGDTPTREVYETAERCAREKVDRWCESTRGVDIVGVDAVKQVVWEAA